MYINARRCFKHQCVGVTKSLSRRLGMEDNTKLAAWWVGERERDFTRLEYTLLGALFGSIGTNFLMVVILFFRT